MNVDLAMEKALREMKQISPYVVASKSGAEFVGGKFHLPLFDQTFLVHYPEVRIEGAHDRSSPPEELQLVLLHYLFTADGAAVADQWITYRYLPGGHLFSGQFYNLAIRSLVQTFGNDIEGFRQACLSLGGNLMSRSGDAAFRFLGLPRVPLACLLYLGDEEVAPGVNILFDAAVPHYLPTEDLCYLGVYLSSELRSYRR